MPGIEVILTVGDHKVTLKRAALKLLTLIVAWQAGNEVGLIRLRLFNERAVEDIVQAALALRGGGSRTGAVPARAVYSFFADGVDGARIFLCEKQSIFPAEDCKLCQDILVFCKT